MVDIKYFNKFLGGTGDDLLSELWVVSREWHDGETCLADSEASNS